MLLCLLVSFTGIQAQEVSLDFTSNDWGLPEGSANKAVNTATFTNGEYSIELTGSSGAGYYFNADGYLMLGKSGASLSLPAFDFAVSKIEIVGRTGASTSTLQNIYVGETAVSTQCKGSTATNVFEIAADYQAAGNVYTLKIESKHNAQITYIKVYSTEGSGTETETSNYTPSFTGEKTRSDRNIAAVSLTGEANGEFKYALDATAQALCYVDATETQIFKVAAGEEVLPVVETNGSWVHFSVLVDADANGFTAGIADGSDWQPTGDLVSYSFYNNGAASDEKGWNSVGDVITGDNRNKPALPAFVAPTVPGTYRMRYHLDWCSIDPMGDQDGKFGDFMQNGGQIVDVMLEVTKAPLTVSTIADVIAAGAADVAKVEGTIVATYARGFLVQDATGTILVYEGSDKGHAIGDVVTVEGKTSPYGGLLQFSNVEVVKTGATTVEYPSATVLDGAALDAYISAPYIKYVKYTGTLAINNNYYNVNVDGATTAVGSIQYPKDGIVNAELNGKVVTVTGYVIGISGTKYVSTMATKVEEYVEAAPLTVVNVTPTETSCLSVIEIEFSEDIVSNYGEDGKINLRKSAVVASITNIVAEGKILRLTLDEHITEPATYGFTISKGKVASKATGVTFGGGNYSVTVTEPEQPVVDEATVALVATVKEALEACPTTVGYPAEAPRAALKAAVDAAEAAPTTEAGVALEAAVADFYASTDIILPEAGKAYTFTAMYGGEAKYYIYNNNGALALGAEAEVPEAAKFVCEVIEGDYKFQFKTADGTYYLAYPTIGGKSWLDNESETGLETDKSLQVTKFNVAKILAGGNVAAQNSELLGLVKMDGYRGYDNGKNVDAFGPIVIKHSAAAFDGAADAFYNANFTSAFAIQEVELAAPVEPLTVVGVTPNEAVEVLDVMTVEFSDEIAGEFDVMGMTQIYVGSKSNGAAYEVNGKVLTIDLFNAITTPGEYALHIPAGLIKRVSDGSDITCNGEIVFTVKEAGYEYNTGDRNHAERALTSFTITDGTNSLNVTDIHQTGKGAIFVDKTDNVLETTAGAKIHFTEFNYSGVWMHAYAYIDYNNDYTFGQDANADGTTGGELVTYNCYSTNESDYYDIWGNVASPSNANHETYYDEDFNESMGLPHFFLPADLAAGDYRMRIKVDWNNFDPVQGSKDMVNGGCEVDFIIRVAEVKPLAVENITPEPGTIEKLSQVVVTFDKELVSVDASKITLNSNKAAIEDYVGAWDITSAFGTYAYETVLNVEIVEIDGVKTLKVRGASGYDDYDDSFYMSYDEATGNVTLASQSLAQYNGYESTLFMGYSAESGLDYGSLTGNIVNGNIVFTSEEGADSFILCYYNGGYKVLSYFCELTWTPSAADSKKAVKLENKSVKLMNIAPVKKAAKADETADVTVAAEVNGKELVITVNGALAEGAYKIVVAEGAVVAANGATNEEVKVVYNVYREETAVVAVTPAQAVTELDVITVEYNVDIEGEFDVMGMTQIYVGSKSNGAAYEVNGKVLTIDLFNAITTPGEYALHIPAGLIKRVSDGSDITCNGEIVFTVKEPGYEYVEGNSGNGSRRFDSFTITDGTNSLTVTDIQATTTSPIFADKTANVLETVAGATISFTEFNWEGWWMHAYGYIDYNNDYTFGEELNADGTTGGELVTYNYYTPDDNTTATDSWNNPSNAETANSDTYYDEDFNESKGLPMFILPADLANGDYRMRVKIDWNNLDPMCSSDIRAIGGCQCDFIIRIGEATGIENVEVENDAQVIYDLTGRKVQNANVRGIYIINGKKVLVK